jgi:hypothetical protein
MGVWFGMEWDDTLFLHIVFGVQGDLRFGVLRFIAFSENGIVLRCKCWCRWF